MIDQDFDRALRDAILREAISFIGTKYYDRASASGGKGLGVDCATFAMLVYQSVDLVPRDYTTPMYYPMQWLKKEEDRTYLTEVLKFAVEVPEAEAKPGDLALFKLLRSYTHGTILMDNTRVIHVTKESGVIYADRYNDTVLRRRDKRYFSFIRKKFGGA